MFLKKRFIALFLAVFLIVSSVTGGYKEAYALPVAIPLVVVLMLLVGSVAVGAGVDIQIDDWTSLTKDLSVSMYNGDVAVSNWMAEIFSWAIDGQGKTMLSALTAGTAITAINLWDYSIPIGAATIATTVVIKNAVIDFLCDMFGIDDLKEQEPLPITDSEKIIINSALQRQITSGRSITHPYLVVSKRVVDGNVTMYSMSICETPIYACDDYTSGYKQLLMIGQYTGVSFYYTNEKNGIFDNMQLVQKQITSNWSAMNFSNEAIIYTNYDIYNMHRDYNGNYVRDNSIYLKKSVAIPIKATAIDLTNDDDLDVIPITSGLATKIADINIDNVGDIKSTDQLVSISADAIVDTKPRTITDVWNRVKALPVEIGVAVNGVLEKAFVPSQAAVDNFVTTAQEKVESGTSIFTYPFEVVVAFTDGFNDLGVQDCILVIPKIEFKDYTLYPGYSFNFTQYVAQSHFATIYTYYLYFVNFVLSISVLNLALRKWDEFMTGGM